LKSTVINGKTICCETLIKKNRTGYMQMDRVIMVRGAKTNNLKNIDVTIPREKITAIVGVSGAGKTSLAFDTIYAEGYLRYIESISPYIRQFLDKIEKPPVECIEGLPPAISFKQKTRAKNPRSIVATSLDIYDYLRLLYSKIGVFHCPGCGGIIKKYSIDEILKELLTEFPHQSEKIEICFPYQGDVAFLVNRGYYFYMEEGRKKRIDASIKEKPIDVLIDSVEIDPSNRSRLFEALDKSLSLGNGPALFYCKGEKKSYPSGLYCHRCNIRYQPADEHQFSFNNPKGACPECKGFGDIQILDHDLIFDRRLSLEEGAARPFNSPAARKYGKQIVENAEKHGIDIHRPIKNLSEPDIAYIMEGDEHFGGIHGFFQRLKSKSYKVQARVFISRYTTYKPCGECGGTRLNSLARSFRINGKSIADFLSFTIREAAEFIRGLKPSDYAHAVSPEVFSDMGSRLEFLEDTGLSYIRLDRPTFTLSRGEFQRINMAFILGSTLSDSLLVLDQPSSDLHPIEYEKLKVFLTRLKDAGNTLLIIEHNADIVRCCDHVIELGPLTGKEGGNVVFSGSTSVFFSVPSGSASATVSASALTLTQRYFMQPPPVGNKGKREKFGEWLDFENCDTHNLKQISVRVPRGAFTVIVGVSGAGKTTLLYHEMYLKGRKRLAAGRFFRGIKEMVFIDPGLRELRGNAIVAGFFDVFSAVRELYGGLKESKLQNYTAGHFSFNSVQGQCESCKGKGYTEMEMQFLPPVNLVCGQCGGTGFKPDILKIKYKEWNIHEILGLSIDAFMREAGEDMPGAKRDILNRVIAKGLGYLSLGQRLKTLSAGELQRIKLIKHLNTSQTGTLFLIDEPSFGMHPYDIEMVKQLIDGLVEGKNTVVAAEHNINLIDYADYIIELGPEGGDRGGYLLFQGTGEEIDRNSADIRGPYLKKNFKNT